MFTLVLILKTSAVLSPLHFMLNCNMRISRFLGSQSLLFCLIVASPFGTCIILMPLGIRQ